MKQFNTEIMQGAIDAIITARDFCGNEPQAVRDYAADNGILNQWHKLYAFALPLADAQYNQYRIAARGAA